MGSRVDGVLDGEEVDVGSAAAVYDVNGSLGSCEPGEEDQQGDSGR